MLGEQDAPAAGSVLLGRLRRAGLSGLASNVEKRDHLKRRRPELSSLRVDRLHGR
jgi:hypothetical protein